MRLVVTLLWCLAALLWLPWLLQLIRWIIDVATGMPWDQSGYFPEVWMGIWPKYGWFRAWGVVSWWPVAACAASGITALGWRVYWLDQEGILTRPGWLVALSIIIPPLAPAIMYRDARRRHWTKENELEHEVLDAKDRLA